MGMAAMRGKAFRTWRLAVTSGTWRSWARPTNSQSNILQGSRAVFNVAGNQYRLVVKINYAYRIVYIRFLGTHQDYDKIDVNTV